MYIIHQLIARNQGIAITLAEIVVFTVLISLIIYHLLIYYGRRNFAEGKLYLHFSFMLSGFLVYIFLDTNLYFITVSQLLNTDTWTTFFIGLSLCLIFFSFRQISGVILKIDPLSARRLKSGFNIYLGLQVLWLLPVLNAFTFFYPIIFLLFWLITGVFIVLQWILYYKNYKGSRKQTNFEVKLIIVGVLTYIAYMWVYRIFLMRFPGQLPLWMINNLLKIAMAFTFAYALARKFNREFYDLAALKENLEEKVEESTLELRRAKEEIEKESSRRTDYFIQVAHETKTPLTLIGNYLHRLRKLQGKSEELNIIDENIQMLRETMIRFLDAEKFGKGQMVYNHNHVTDISRLLSYKIPLFKDLAMQLGVEFRSSITENLCVRADQLAIERIVNNLYDNALKFTPEYGHINLTMKAEKDKAVLEVSDTGIGIVKAEQEKIFHRYYQSPATGNQAGGLGMGLYIVKQTVESLKGDVFVDSKPGQGSVFKVILPLCLNETSSTAFEIGQHVSSKSALKLKTEFSENNKNICIIEDNTEMLVYLAMELNEDYNVFTAVNGAEALRVLATSPRMDLILSDVMMREMDGYNLFETIRTHPTYQLIPFIFITARSNHDEKIEFLNRGASDYIYKPFSIDELKAKISSVLQNSAGQRKAGLNDAIEAIHNRLATPATLMDKWKIFETRIRDYGLTERQTEVIKEVEKGYDYKQIAKNLHVSQKTIHRHMQILFEKFQVHTKMDLLKKLFE